MTFLSILQDVYRRTGFASSPAADVVTRIKAFVNETQQEILREPGMQYLLNDETTLASAASQAEYGLAAVVDKIKAIRDSTNNITLQPMSLEEYRNRYPAPANYTGTPVAYVDLGEDTNVKEPSDASTIYVISTSGSDTNIAYLEGFLSNGDRFSVNVTMNGATAVNFTPNTVTGVTKFWLSAAAVGTVTLREDSGTGTVLATIIAGDTQTFVRKIALVPTPSGIVTYNIDFERRVQDMTINTEEPPIPQRFHYLLAVGARMKEYEKTNDLSRWNLAKAEFEQGLRKLKFWIYESTVGRPNLRGSVYKRPSISEGGSVASSSSSSTPTTVPNGGTGFSSYTVGDLLVADTTVTLAKLNAGADGKVLRAAGAGVVPAYSTFTIPDTFTANRVLYATAANTLGTSANFTFDGSTLTLAADLKFTDATFDIGKSGATRPRDGFFSRNLDAQGTLNVAGATTLNGTVALGNAAADTITVPGTIGSNLLFTDASFDIGASGATRPRDLFLSRDAVVGGTLGVTGVATFTAQAVFTGGWRSPGTTYINDTSNADLTLGLTINQGANDDQILALKSSDVAHGITSIAETDTYVSFKKAAAATGGLLLDGLGGGSQALFFRAFVTSVDGTRSTAGVGAITNDGFLKSGTTGATLGADKNIVVFRDAGTTRFILDSDGDSHQDVGTAWTNFDDDDDIARLDALSGALAREGDPLRHEFITNFEQHRSLIESMPGKPLVSFNEDGHHFVNMSRLAMLLTGAVRQLARDKKQLAARLATIERRLPA